MTKESYAYAAQQLRFEPSGPRLTAHLLVDLALAAEMFLSFRYTSFALCLLTQLLIPVLMFRAFALMHECVHGSASRCRVTNEVVGTIAGAFCLLPFEPWKKIHLAHHKWAGNVDRDPSMGLIKAFPTFGKARLSILSVAWRWWLPGLAISQHVVFWSKSYQFVLAGEGRAERVRNALSVLVPLALYFVVPWGRVIPGLVLYLLMVEVINFPHHLQMPMVEGNASFPVFRQDLTARSCQYPRWLARHVLNNFNLHIEHHLFPRLPWYRLDEASILVRAQNCTSYTAVRGNGWIRENRRKALSEVLSANLNPEARNKAA